ncbi:MAG: response regulator [Hydrogenophaga sp.]|nr:response regulator [Hydrogenophaga sp.]
MREISPPRMPHILVIDDSREMLDHLGMMLAPNYELSQADNGETGLAIAMERLPDLILLDVCMEGTDGYTVCERLKEQASTRHIPVVLMSAYIDTEGEARAFEVGASDCLRKPINERIAASRIQVQLSLKAAQDLNRDREAALEQEVRRRTEHIELTQHVALLALVNLARTRDTETGGHIVRTQAYVRMLAERLREHPRFSAELTPNAIRLITQSAPLHDIGKIGIPDHILRKPGALTPEEMTIMRTHTTLGLQALEDAERLYDRRVDFLRYAKDIVIGHHERWDGKGYPYGLKGDAIPVAARLMAVADVFDALISKRVYKEAFPQKVAFDIIQQGSGTQFDPDIVDAFVDLSERFAEIVHIHRDGERSSVAA